jgi:EmrB/QacA subfamily drug resistance transporter
MSFGSDNPALKLDPRAKLEIYGAILLALFLFALDQTVVGVALPRIVTDLKGNELYTWAVTVYLLTATISGPIYGKLSDLFGRRPIFIWAVGLFLFASIAAGLSQEMWQFILFRGLQGLGGGAIFPVSLAVVADLYTPVERGKYMGAFGAVFGLSSVIGPFLGGLITDAASWHWIFFVNVPVALVSLVVCWRLLPSFRRPGAARNIDYVGAAVFAAAIAPFLIGLTNKGQPNAQWTDPAVGGLMLLGVALLAVFLWIESRVIEPIVPLGLFRVRSFTVSVIAMFMAAFGFFGAVIFLPRWFQSVREMSALESGLSLLPLIAALIVGATASGQIVARTQRYKTLMLGSFVLLAIGLFLLTNLRSNTDLPILWLWMLIAGLGIGPSFAVFTLVVQNSVNPERIGAATSSLTFFQQIGGTVGLTIAGTIFASRFTEEVPVRLEAAGVPAPFAAAFAQGGSTTSNLAGTGSLADQIRANVPDQVRAVVEPIIPAIVAAIHDSISIAIASSFWVGIVGAIVGAIVVIFLEEVPMRDTFEMAPVTSEPGETASAAGSSSASAAAD